MRLIVFGMLASLILAVIDKIGFGLTDLSECQIAYDALGTKPAYLSSYMITMCHIPLFEDQYVRLLMQDINTPTTECVMRLSLNMDGTITDVSSLEGTYGCSLT